MAVCNKHHLELDANGVGKCSVPMWGGGCPAGFCDEPAYGRPLPDNGYDGYVPGLACPGHGGPMKPEISKPVVVVPLDQWRRLVELIGMERHANINPWPEIDAIIASVEVGK